VPIISFGWHHFAYKNQIEPLGIFHFARTLADCRALIQSAIDGKLEAYRGGDIRLFLTDTKEEEIRAVFAGIGSHQDSDVQNIIANPLARNLNTFLRLLWSGS